MEDFRARVGAWVESTRIQRVIITVIILNAVTLGLETWSLAMDEAGGLIGTLDRIFLAIFVVEIGLKLFAHGPRFFRSGWNIFDFVVVGVALMPATGHLSVLRALRILRVLRLISIVPQMRKVVTALLSAIPGLGSIGALLMLLYYVSGVMATKLFGETFPQWFGSIGASMYSLFQIMTLESWSMGIVRPVMEVYPLAWLFFVPFILITTFAVLNLFIGIIVSALQEVQQAETEDLERTLGAEHRGIEHEIVSLRDEMRALRQELAGRDGGDPPTPREREPAE